jgi:hypothetical protein
MAPENNKNTQPSPVPQNQSSQETPPEKDDPGDDPPPNPQGDLVTAREATLLGFYFLVLGLVLIYLTAVIWPPDFNVTAKATNDENAKDVPSPIIFYKRTVLLNKQPSSGITALSPTPGKSPGKPQGAAAPTTKPSVSNTISQALGNSPERPQDTASPTSEPGTSKTTVYQANISYDRRLLLLVIVTSALGSFIHIVSSFVDFVGNRRLTRSWIWWYVLRPYVGVPMAVLFYFVVRAGFLSSGVSAGEVNRFGIAAVAGLVGMFSMTAGDKLKELFDTLFKTDKQQRKDTLANPLPVVQSIKPSKQVAGAQSVDVVVSGSGFIPTSVVKVGNVGRETQFRNPKELSVKLLPEDIAKVGTVSITVTNPPPGGGDSAPAVLLLENPAPVITSIEPTEGGTKLRIVGSGFMADSVGSVNGVVKSAADTSFVNATELTIAHRSASGDKIEIKVSNPEPGGGTSEKTFTV